MADTGNFLSQKITLGVKPAGAAAFTVFDNILEIPIIGGKPDKVEITSLSDSTKRYMSGINDPGELAFKFLYENSGAASSYRIMKGLEGQTAAFEVTYPDGTKHDFSAQITVQMDAAKQGQALTFTVIFVMCGGISVTNP
jgi:hypothetical protein